MDKKVENLLEKDEKILAKINYELTTKRIKSGYDILYKHWNWFYLVFALALVYFIYIKTANVLLSIGFGLFFFLFITLVYRNLYYRIMAKRVLKTINKKFIHNKMFFCDDKLVIIHENQEEAAKMMYEDFYRIKKTKKAYMFYIQKYSFYYVEFSEFQENELNNVNNALKAYLK